MDGFGSTSSNRTKSFNGKYSIQFLDIHPFDEIINGFIVKIKSKNQYKGKLLEIQDVNDNSFIVSDELWKTLNWISKYII